MARKSRSCPGEQRDHSKKVWRAALYMRLSRDDGDKSESDSITNQRSLLREYLLAQSDITSSVEYADDGWSGTTFDRPQFQQMISEIKLGTINCVIVKDLSRFGRNYIEAGNYLEQVFPFLDVRFISINDNIDSFNNPESANNIFVPFKNLLNDEYARDISMKVRSSLTNKRKSGKFVGSFASYGYRKDPNDHNQLVIDEYAAATIRDIYKWFLEGFGMITIAKMLNERGMLNPTAYKKHLGLKYKHPSRSANDTLWGDSSVRRILMNKLYTGTLVQGKNKVTSYKVKKVVAQHPGAWIEVENTHEAIIDIETFERVQSMLNRDSRTSPSSKKLYVFSGFLRCFDCNKAMNRRKNVHPYGEYIYYSCSTFKKMSSGACTKHSIRHDILEKAVLATIQHQIQIAVSMEEVVSAINERGQAKNDKRRLLMLLNENENGRLRIEQYKLTLYHDYRDGVLTKDEYFTIKEQYDEQIAALDRTISILQEELLKYDKGVDGKNAFLMNFLKHRSIEALTRELVSELVNYIYIHEDKSVTIDFKYQDEYQRAVEFIEQNHDAIASA